MKKLIPILLLVFFTFHAAIAQEDIFGLSTKSKSQKSESAVGNAFRNAVSNFSFEFSAGGNYHLNETDFSSQMPSRYPIAQFQNFENPRELSLEDTLSLKGNNYAYPVNLGVRINLFSLLTIGGGYGREFGNMSSMRGEDQELSFESGKYTFDKFYGTVGIVLYDAKKRAKFLSWKYRKYGSQNIYMQSEKNQRIRQQYPWRFILEGEYGTMKIRKSYDSNLLVSQDPYYGIALRMERDLSEYTKLFIKTGAEVRSFIYQSSEITDFQNIKQTLFGAQIGFALRLPGTKRCRIQGCGVVMKHLHNGVEHRGSSIFNFQNRKVGQWY
ncbi:hypothetical protein P872_04960 [Rhodonellum psychrophilum GCM71 = DSM 17998]|uniref:Outer membrane protein beta-barrel domain-containing protein n=2 Tax=Rhodonellum TaxID=336827 RepID=U5C219_9BACT|nr:MULTISPECIES: hypothetical protein [Rhodonellum]ERM82966.1 hypothetical protein P872_04960 [Rhodonellum psychrophilum GCM71 = DSM 17998]SDZ36489.1 hypothetical protein SAMN05444412_111111 [Rhodonellum ikkaensis]